MADTQSTFSEDVTMEDPCQFLKMITNVCKQNRDLLSSLPEVMEFLLVNGEVPLNQMCQFEEHSFQKMQRELHELKEEVTKKDDEKRKREKEILENDKLHEKKLASISERQVKLDQRKTEDTHALNRQSDLEKDFAMFFDFERLDACEAMLSIYQNKEDEFNFIYYPRLACIILETAYEQAQEARNACVDLFKEFTRMMVDDAAQMGTKVIQKRKLFMEGKGPKDPQQLLKACVMKEPTKFPKDAIDGVLLSMKENAESCDLDSLMERDPAKGKEGFLEKVFEKWIKWSEEDKACLFTPSYHLLEKLDQYIKACLRLSWRIVTQVPPMNLEYQTLKLNSNIHKKLGHHTNFKGREKSLLSRQENQEEEIACYIWPGLQDGGGRVIKVGEVLCVIQEDEKSGNRPERKR